MRAIAISAFGAPEVLVPVERPDPTPAPGEMLVRVTASGINRPDVLQRKGAYAPPPGASDLPGLEIAGTVVGGDAAELAAAGFTLGDRVCALVAGGGYAERCTAPIPQCLPIPGGLSDLEAASLPETFFTVWSNVFDRGRLKSGETLLIQGGASGIGVTAICPGIIDTFRMDDVGRGEQWERMIAAYVPLRRAGTGLDVANMVVYLCSEQGAWISGQLYSVDGGMVPGR